MSPEQYRSSWNPTEREFQDCIVSMARAYGWTVFHPYEMRRSAPGWPDLTLARPGRLIFWEVKTRRGRVRAAQRVWLELLASVPGVIAGVVRPDQWDECIAILAGDEAQRGAA